MWKYERSHYRLFHNQITKENLHFTERLWPILLPVVTYTLVWIWQVCGMTKPYLQSFKHKLINELPFRNFSLLLQRFNYTVDSCRPHAATSFKMLADIWNVGMLCKCAKLYVQRNEYRHPALEFWYPDMNYERTFVSIIFRQAGYVISK